MKTPLSPPFYKTMLDHLAEGVYFVDRERHILYWNRAAAEISGFRSDEVVGSRCGEELLDHRDAANCSLCNGRCPLSLSMETGQAVEDRVFLRRRDGQRIPVDVRVVPIEDDSGGIVGAVELFSDASGTVAIERVNEELRQLIRIDPLTHIPNRLAMLEALEREYQRYLRYTTPFSLLFVDIDHFKRVNDRHGHHIGDRALAWLAGKMVVNVRRSDMVGRYGGEEFLVLLTSTRLEEAYHIAEHLRANLQQDASPETGEVITASVGVATIRADEGVERLIERADRALYRAKQLGRNRVELETEAEDLFPAGERGMAP